MSDWERGHPELWPNARRKLDQIDAVTCWRILTWRFRATGVPERLSSSDKIGMRSDQSRRSLRRRVLSSFSASLRSRTRPSRTGLDAHQELVERGVFPGADMCRSSNVTPRTGWPGSCWPAARALSARPAAHVSRPKFVYMFRTTSAFVRSRLHYKWCLRRDCARTGSRPR